ncbi:MAG: carboxylesterase family protein [Lachnospiraceae bacterium]|nr:carboxylesterase family protein [Lachnospiraceae bacterium]
MGKFEFDNVPVLKTTGGDLKGYYYKGEYIFKGVPYAKAKRFHQPEPAKWSGVKEATSYGMVCPLRGKDYPNGELYVPHRYWPQDEHCQNLNIWTKNLDESEKRPVLVWFHGGGYEAGSSIEQVAYDGFNLCMDKDVVVVTVNHRLNILGYLDLSPFGEEYKNSANAGNADMVAALKWVHDNISLFGGNPECVTIFGQSGGGMKVTDLMQTPSADGLFQRAMVMSGVAGGGLFKELEGDGTEIVNAMIKELNLKSVKELEEIDYYDMARAYNKVSPALAANGHYIGCVPVKNDFFLGNPLVHGFREEAFKIPLMVGSVFGEFFFAPMEVNKREVSKEEELEILKKIYGDSTEDILAEYKKAYPDKCGLDLMCIDRCMRQPSKELAKIHAAGGGKSFLYMFTFEFPINNGKIAWHCSDIPFLFRNTEYVEVCSVEGVTDKLEDQISSAFVSFAVNGDPNNLHLPKWESVSVDKEPTMIYDRNCEVRYNYDDALYEKIDSVLPPFNLHEMIATEDIQH